MDLLDGRNSEPTYPEDCIMNGSEPRYSREYVELRTSLEHIRTRLQSLDSSIRTMESTFTDFEKLFTRNRMEVASIKTIAVVMGGIAGSVVAGLFKWFFQSTT